MKFRIPKCSGFFVCPDMIQSLHMPLMTYDEYESLDPRPKKPYPFSIQSDHNALYYFGEGHSYDPYNEQWVEEKIFWQSFLKATEGQKRIVFVEGRKRSVINTEEQAILTDGGMGLATYLAHQEGIDTFCPEPDRTYEKNELIKQFSKEEVQYYYFARVVGQWNRKQEPRPDFEEYINGFLERDKNDSKWTDFDFSLNHMKEVHTVLFERDFDEHDNDFFYNVTNPVKLVTTINKVSRASTEIRDKYIVEQIQKYMNAGYSIFIQFGATHAVMQESLLKELFCINL